MTLKAALAVAWWSALILQGIASPYIVYTGTTTGTATTASGAVPGKTIVTVLTDLADTSQFAILLEDPNSKIFSVLARPSSSSPTAGEADNNFFADVGAGSSARAALAFGVESPDSSGGTTVFHAYFTGPLLTKTAVLVPARSPLLVHIKTATVACGTYQFPASAAISTDGLPYPHELTGTWFGFEISSAGDVIDSVPAMTLTLTESPSLTALANVGGEFTSAKGVSAMLPVRNAADDSAAATESEWLSAYAAINYSSSDDLSGPTSDASLNGLNLIAGSAISAGKIGAGTLTLHGLTTLSVGPGTYTSAASGVVSAAGFTSGLDGLLVLGGAPVAYFPASSNLSVTSADGNATLSISDFNFVYPPANGQTELVATNEGINDSSVSITSTSNSGLTGYFSGIADQINFVNAVLSSTNGLPLTGPVTSIVVGSGTVTNRGGTLTFTGGAIYVTPTSIGGPGGAGG